MTTTHTPQDRLAAALESTDSSARLSAALTAGTTPDARFVPVLVDQCAIEPDFYVRDMLTWALTRHEADDVVPLLLDAVATGIPQARSQALHSLSKVGDARGWGAIDDAVLADPDIEVAKAAWRCAVRLAPYDERPDLARRLVLQLGRGDKDVRLSLSRSLMDLAEEARPILREIALAGSPARRDHARATLTLIEDADADR